MIHFVLLLEFYNRGGAAGIQLSSPLTPPDTETDRSKAKARQVWNGPASYRMGPTAHSLRPIRPKAEPDSPRFSSRHRLPRRRVGSGDGGVVVASAAPPPCRTGQRPRPRQPPHALIRLLVHRRHREGFAVTGGGPGRAHDGGLRAGTYIPPTTY